MSTWGVVRVLQTGKIELLYKDMLFEAADKLRHELEEEDDRFEYKTIKLLC